MNRPCRAAILALAALTLGAPGAAATIPAPPSEWYKLPGLNAASGAQWARAFAYSTPPNVVYAGLEGGGVFRSDTGGATWSAFNAGFPNPLTTNVRALLTSSTGTTVYAGTDSGVWKSTGGAWQPLGQGAGTGKLNGSVQSLISLPGGVLLAGVASGGVWKSSDGGATWKPPADGNGMPASETPYGFVGQPPQLPQFVLSASSHGVFRSTDGGNTWTLASDGIPGSASPIQPWVDTTSPNLMYVSTSSNGIYRSLNAGLTWSEINDGLGAVRARGFQIFTGAQGAHLYAATEEGLWEGFNTHAVVPPAPHWRPVTQQGLHEVNPAADNVIMWALTAPVIPGAGAFGLIAGTQSNGGYFLGFAPPDSQCPLGNTTDVTTKCPRISGTPVDGKGLSALNGIWTGTPQIDYEIQWQQCTSTTLASCTDIPGAEESGYVIPDGSTLRYRVEVTATNPAPTGNQAVRGSAITAATTPNPGNIPGATQFQAPSITVTPAAHATSPTVGDSLFAEDGTLLAADPTYGWFNPAATFVSFQWLRCDSSGNGCDEIAGATARGYTLTSADGTHDLRVRVTGTNAAGSRQLTSSPSYDVISSPAAIAAPIPDPDGGPAKSQAPALAGTAWVGETLAGTVGGWQDPTTEFSRRWVRCDAVGAACTYIQKVASTDPETDPDYVVRAADLGYTLRMRVTADVNGDLGDDGIDNHLPHAVEVDTPQTAVVALRPAGGGGPGPGGGAGPDTVAPILSALSVSHRRFAVGAATTPVAARAPKGTKFKFVLSELATVRIAIARLAPGRRAGGRCRKPTRALRHHKRCKRALARGTLTRAARPAGANAIRFSGRIGTRKLERGAYRASLRAGDGAGNVSAPARVGFKVVRR